VAAGADAPRKDGPMRVKALDHVNLVAVDLEAAARYYVQILGLERRNAPPPLTPADAQWLHDSDGRAIIHLNSIDCPRLFDRDLRPGPTGALHHVALNCSGYAEMLARLAARGLDYRLNEVPAIGLRQIFTLDPNGVLLELNFFGD
jgi:catechol 2,3-dioxygenase-like lactoylglutathione lyase family enzyme